MWILFINVHFRLIIWTYPPYSNHLCDLSIILLFTTSSSTFDEFLIYEYEVLINNLIMYPQHDVLMWISDSQMWNFNNWWLMVNSFVSEYYWAPMSGKVGATCRSLAANCTFGVHRLFGTNEWKSRCNQPSPAASCSPGIYRLLGID